MSDGISQEIAFKDLSLENAIARAKAEGKNVIVDTYADWCIPCKKMDLEFKREELSSFFNENYINVRINMDNSLQAAEYKKKFDIVFLPTIIILDKYGNVKYKTDKFIPGQELLVIAKKSMNANVYFLNDAVDIVGSPMGGSVRSGPEVIVHKLGAPNDNPEILMKEAYFRIELMDGSHRAAATKYLESQNDWATEKNMKFILDFLYNTHAPEFEYLLTNLDRFRATFGNDKINQSLEILINDELANGYPRPDFNTVLRLMTALDDGSAEKRCYEYFMERYLDECDMLSYKKTAINYLNKYPANDPSIYAALGLQCVYQNEVKAAELEQCISATKKASDLEKTSPYHYEQLVQLYLLKKDRSKALKALEKAFEMAKLSHHKLDYYIKLKEEIEHMN